MEGFEVTKIGKHIFCILDAGNSSFYMIEGDEKAAVIDTGITTDKKILPLLRELTDKPLLLVATHAHLDHIYHMDEFEEVYMCHDEKKIDATTLRTLTVGRLKPWDEIHDIHTGSVIFLGGTELRICQVPGHTPGSVVILEARENYLFTGDAIGSGCGVWMQVPGSTDLKTYYDSLIHLMHWLVDNGGRMKFFGGHHMQAFESVAHPVYNPLGLGVLADLIDLVAQVLSGEIQGRPSNVSRAFTQEPLLYASYGRAEMQYLLSQK
ncbi:MBL fold metallo-hydrolase [Blautia faecicola]|uniref:MBL fold metallo-hydrolase n=1 Tax=Blautia faecicola TaxID=2509240 RepID=A0A4Q1RIT3_9FIRM|nr:MBL fold metallo-hydrolase [Blautia faecicola]RXS75661.1 MBL fold metallo-hydrolase [Blautia faecicola]